MRDVHTRTAKLRTNKGEQFTRRFTLKIATVAITSLYDKLRVNNLFANYR